MLLGIVYAFILPGMKDLYTYKIKSGTLPEKRTFLNMEIVMPAFFSFIFVLAVIILTNPVPTEGWLRTTYISVLLASQSSFIFLLVVSLTGEKISGRTLSILSLIFLATVPFGLLLHHPWTYIAFFSPFYWISWAWVTDSLIESLLYGAISMVITSGCIVWLLIRYFKKHKN